MLWNSCVARIFVITIALQRCSIALQTVLLYLLGGVTIAHSWNLQPCTVPKYFNEKHYIIKGNLTLSRQPKLNRLSNKTLFIGCMYYFLILQFDVAKLHCWHIMLLLKLTRNMKEECDIFSSSPNILLFLNSFCIGRGMSAHYMIRPCHLACVIIRARTHTRACTHTCTNQTVCVMGRTRKQIY